MDRIDIDREMAIVVASIGGEVLDRRLHNESGVAIADYYFDRFQTIVELKRLEDDLASKDDFNQSVKALYMSWVKDGLVPPQPDSAHIQIKSQEIPESCTRQFVNLVKKRIENSTIKKANKQLKATKDQLGIPNAKGWLLIANDGNLLLHPDMMLNILARAMNGQYRAIHAAAYFSVNELARSSIVSQPSPIWIDGVFEGRDPPPEALRNLLQTEWVKHFAKLKNRPVLEVLGDNSASQVDSLRFIERADRRRDPPRK